MRRLLTSAVAAALIPSASLAQDRVTLLDILDPEMLLQQVMQAGVLMLRTQLDLQYGDMRIDIRSGSVTMTDLSVWPLPDWDPNGDCQISADRLVLRSNALDEPERLRFKAQMSNVYFNPICLPEEPREALAMAGLSDVFIPRITFDLDYDIPSSGAVYRMHADIADVAAVSLDVSFSYIWFDGRDDIEEPIPVMFLESAELSVENSGIWSAMQPMLPPPFTSEGAGLVVQGALGQGLLELNQQCYECEDTSLSDGQNSLLDTLATAWPAFLAAPETLVVTSQIDGDAYLDIEAIDDDPRVLFDALMPIVRLKPLTLSEVLPVDLLSAALDGTATDLSDADRKAVGIALLTGAGAPRNVSAGLGLLDPIALSGDGEAALHMGEALMGTDPEGAYFWTLIAGATDEFGAATQLDRIERKLDFATILQIQGEVAAADGLARDALDKVSTVREQASLRWLGQGASRSYELAAMWAMIGAAAGDGESADILADIDQRVRLAGTDAAASWAEAEAAASDLAMQAWIGEDLATRYAE